MRRLVWLVVVLLALIGCTPSSQVRTAPTSTSSSLAALATTAPAPTPGPVPAHCPVSNPVRQTLPGIAPVIGAAPVWATWPPGLGTFHLTPVAPYTSTYVAPYGWEITKIIWEVGPHYARPISVRGHDVRDGTPLMLQFLADTPTATAVLDPQHPDHPASAVGADWAEWGSYIVVPKAGCYVMEVSWPAGHWDVTFAAGA